MKDLFVHHIENEVVVEALRQKLNRDSAFDLKDAFAFLDKDRDGYITIYEVKLFFCKSNLLFVLAARCF